MGSFFTANAEEKDDSLQADPYLLIISYWVRQLSLTNIYDTHLNPIIISYSNYIGINNHCKRKQIIAIRKWNSKCIEHEQTKSNIVKEWLSNKHKNWICEGRTYKCSAYNEPKKTLHPNHKNGVVLICNDYMYCQGIKVLLPPLSKETVFGSPDEIYPCRKCNCILFQKHINDLCECSHSISLHFRSSAYPDEYDGMVLMSNIIKSKIIKLQEFADLIKMSCVKNIICLTGAGISTSCGIPDFRSPKTGLYDNLQQYNLSKPEDIFTLEYFLKNPQPFYMLAKELFPDKKKYTPSVTHYFLKLLSDKGILLRVYTQNIDGLELMTGLDEKYLVESHGNFRAGYCVKCKKEYKQEVFKDTILNGEIPECLSDICDGVIKPNIVFFGEPLPSKFFKCALNDFKKCDMLIILGTSLSVEPFASLVSRVNNTVPRLLINNEHSVIGLMNEKHRDLFYETDCDEGIRMFVKLLGWTDNLEYLMKTK